MGAVGCGAGKPGAAPAPTASNGPAASSSTPLAPQAVAPPAGEIDGRPELVRQHVGGWGAWSAYSDDGKLAITVLGSSFGLVEIDTGRVLGVQPVECMEEAAFSADNRFVVFSDCGDRGDGVHVWDLARNEVKDTTLHVRAARFVPQEQGHHVLVHSEKSDAAVVDLWSLAVTALELPDDARLQGARFAADGRIVLFGRNGVFHFAEGTAVPIVTSFGPSDGVAAAADLARDRVVVLFADGHASVVDPATAKVISSRKVCSDATHGNVYFASPSTDVVVQCGAAVWKLDAALGSVRQYFQDDSRKDFTVRLVGRRLFVSTGSEVSVFDVVDGSWGGAMNVYSAVILAEGTRVAERNRSLVLDATTGKDIWAPDRTLLGYVAELRAKAAMLGASDAIDLRTGESFDFSSLSHDGSVVMKTIILPDREERPRATVSVADRDTGAAWSFDTDPGQHPDLAPSGNFVVLQTTDAHTHSTFLTVHGPKGARRVDTPDHPMLTLNDLFLVSERVNDKRQYRIGALATGSLATARWEWEYGDWLGFAAGGTRLVLDREIHDTATRGLAWKVPEGERIHWLDADSDLVVLGAVDLGTSKPLRVLSAKDGREIAKVARAGVVRAASNERLLLERDGAFVITDGATETPVSLEGSLARSPMRLSTDGAIVWYQRSDRLVAAHRVADGRELLLGLDTALVTDEGVFDPSDAARVRLLVRSGPNLLESRFSSVTDAPAKYGHPGLVKDFFAGAAVSPRP